MSQNLCLLLLMSQKTGGGERVGGEGHGVTSRVSNGATFLQITANLGLMSNDYMITMIYKLLMFGGLTLKL